MPGSRKLWALKTDSAKVLFFALLASADDCGRLEGAANDVSTIVPRSGWSPETIESDLRDMARVGLINRYKANGDIFIEIVNFQESQRWHGVADKGSKLPAPPQTTKSGVAQHQERQSTTPVAETPPPIYLDRLDGLKDRKTVPDDSGNVSHDYGRFSKKYQRVAGMQPSGAKQLRQAYSCLCSKFGEEEVLARLGVWARDRGGREKLAGNRFAPFDFLQRECADMIPTSERIAAEKTEQDEAKSSAGPGFRRLEWKDSYAK